MKPNISTRKFLPQRIIFLILIIIPFLYWPEFFDHFYVYLTGTVINRIVQNQWLLVIVSILFFAAFLIPLSYRTRANWAKYSLAAAFFVSLFIEMYGIPLTLLFASKYFFVAGAHLPDNFIEFNFLGVGLGMDLAMFYGTVIMVIGMGLILWGWYSLYRQSSHESFARAGLYSYSRHPQYVGFIMLILGWFIGWPTILTLVFSPILIYKYVKAARKEEEYMSGQFGTDYIEYKNYIPFLI